MEASAIEYSRGGRGALGFQHSPLGGSVADCPPGGPQGPHQTEFKQEYAHHNGHPQAAMEHDDIKSCYSSTPSTPPTPIVEMESQPQPQKGRGRKRGGVNKGRDGLGWHAVDHGNPEIFGSKADLQMHTQLHMREAKPYKCSQCSKTFANSSYLSQHTRIHLGIKPYRCEICQRKFTQLSHLQQHIRTHTGDKPYKCRHPGCNKAFSQLSNLQSHSRCHQTDKPYKCNSCYKCFVDEPSLLEHIPKHKESKHLKTHICQYCGKSYTQETYLNKHMQKHAERTDKRPPIIGLGRNALHNLHGQGHGHSQGQVHQAGLVQPNNNNLSEPNVQHPQPQHAYWPKVSPDTANSLVEAINQHERGMEACLQQQQQQQQHNGMLGEHHMVGSHHRALMEHHRHMNGTPVGAPASGQQQQPSGGASSGDGGEDLVLRSQQQQQQQQQQHQQHQNNPTSSPTPAPQQVIVSSPSSAPNGYELGGGLGLGSIKTSAPSSTSAFTPIQSMGGLPPHHHLGGVHLNPHQLGMPPAAARPAYIPYDSLSFPGSKMGGVGVGAGVGAGLAGQQGGVGGSFPNQLISLHQIRNYAHQPMVGEHLLAGLKDKAQ